jgi:hypothetical protein
LNQQRPDVFNRVAKSFDLMQKTFGLMQEVDQVLSDDIGDDDHSSFHAPPPNTRGRGRERTHMVLFKFTYVKSNSKWNWANWTLPLWS